MALGGLLNIADELVLSCEVGYAKPDVRIYQAALERLDVRPTDSLFADDNPGHVEVARLMGMRGHVHWSTLADGGGHREVLRYLVRLAAPARGRQ